MRAFIDKASSLTIEDLKRSLPYLVSALLVTTTTLVIRASLGIRAFPSLDDFAYLPLARRFLNHGLFPDDVFITTSILHAPAWAVVVWLSEHTVGLVLGFYVIVLLLSFFTVLAAWRLLRILGGSGALLPAAAALAFANHVPGLGRGLTDGAFGDGFHTQWLALCFMLWVYIAWLEAKPLRTGVLLGLCLAAHPVVGAHAVIVLGIATLVAMVEVSTLPITLFAAAAIAAPVIVPILATLLSSPGGPSWPASELIEKGYLFRTSHEFTLQLTHSAEAMTLVLLFVLGLVGSILLTQLRSVKCTPGIAGLLSGHAFLAGAFVVFHGDLLPEAWRHVSTLPYLFHLSRTTPVLVVLASVLSVAALEAMFETINPRTGFLPSLRIIFLVGLGFLLFGYVAWTASLIALLVVSGLLIFFRRVDRANVFIIGALILLAVLQLGALQDQAGKELIVVPADQQLYDWVAASTVLEDLFIVPPGFQEFRTYTNRGAFVDFKVFPASTPFLVPEWRRRLELVSAPDEIALRERGWPAVYQLDRTYAQANRPRRIAQLLVQTDADYFVFDKRGEEIPPYLPLHTESDARLQLAFENSRYRVYRLRSSS